MIKTDAQSLGSKKLVFFSGMEETKKKKTIHPSENWRPKTPQDLFRNSDLIKQIYEILDNSNTGTFKSSRPGTISNSNGKAENPLDFQHQPISLLQTLIIRGPIGCGKYELLRVCLEFKGYNINVYDQDFSQDDYSDLKKSLISSGIEFMMGFSQKRAVIIKNYDNNLKNSQQQDLFKFIITENTIPIFFTSHNMNVSASKTIPKAIPEQIFETAFYSNLVSLAPKIISSENLQQISSNKIKTLSKNCRGDVRYFVKTVQRFDKNTNVSDKDINYSIKEKLQTLLDSDKTFDEKLLLTSMHTNFVLQQNYVFFYEQNNKSKDINRDSTTSLNRDSTTSLNRDSTLKDISEMADWIMEGNLVLNYVSRNQGWDDVSLTEQYSSMGTIIPLEIINSKKSKSYKHNDILKKIEYPPNYKMETDISTETLEESAFFMDKIIFSKIKNKNLKKSDSKELLENFISHLYKEYHINDSNLRVICKLASINNNKIKFTQLRTILKNVT
jgi:hypothetical protein